AGKLAGVQKTGGGDDGGAVLVVVEDRDVEFVAQTALDDETLGALYVLEIDAAERGTDVADGGDEFFDVLRRHFDVDGIDVGEAFEENALAFHHRLGRHR